MINKEVQRYTIYIPSGLHKNLKIYAATKSVPISKIIIDLITSFLKENK